MKKDLVHVEFYYPGKDSLKTKEELAGLIIEMMKENDSLGYSGFQDEASLRESILSHIGGGDVGDYTPITDTEKKEILNEIEKVIEKCDSVLPIPTKNYIFVFPYLPDENENVFGGVMGYAPYSCVFQIFVSPQKYNQESLSHTIAHELNHTIFYYHHFDGLNNYTLLDHMIIEGLAENFRERVCGGNPAPWSVSTERGDLQKNIDSLKGVFESKDEVLRKDVLFGNEKEYRKWLGYSVGYWMVREFIEKNEGASWGKLMKTNSEEILENLIK